MRDNAPLYSFPFINYLIIFANIAVFFLEISAPDPQKFTEAWGFVPGSLISGNPRSFITMFTSMWIHGGVIHLFSNIWFLHIFGDNIEDALGHARYLVFYLLAGLVSILAQYAAAPESLIPVIGASGAISGVAGAFFVLFRRTKIKTLVIGIWGIVLLPATVFLGYWFLLQIFQGLGSLVAYANEGGVAWFAHIGGFIAGYAIAKINGVRERYGSLTADDP